MAQVPERVLSWLYSVLHEYHDPQRTYSSVAQTLSAYPTLSPRTEVFTNETGRSALLLVLSGTLPTYFRGAEYRFPIKIWFPHTYPHEAPMVFVTPGGAMAIRPGQHVGTDGRVYHPYLRDWRGMTGAGGWEDGARGGSSLGEFLRVLIGVFEREPPVVSRLQAQQQQHHGNNMTGMASPRPNSSSGSSLPPQLPPKQVHGSVYEPQQPRPQQPPVEMSATTNSPPPPPPPKPPKPGQEPVFPERSTSRNLARDGPPLPPLPHERVGSAQYAASPPPSTPMYPNRTASASRPPPQGMSGYEANAGQHGPPATPLAHQQFQQVRAAAGREGSPVSPMMPNGQGYDQRYSQQFMSGMQGNPQNHPGGQRALFPHHPNHHQQQVPSQQPYHHQGQMNSTSYQQYPPNQPHPQYHYQQQHPPPQQIPPTPQTQKPPPPPDLLTTDPFEISLPTDPSTNTPTSTAAPPIPPNPEKEHLLAALASTLSTQAQHKVSQNLSAVAPLQAQNSALRAAIGRLEKEVQGLDEWSRILDSNEGILRRSIAECEGVVGRYTASTSSTTHQSGDVGGGGAGGGAGTTRHPPIDEILVPPTLVANQLWTLCAEEASCREAMYVLQQAVDRGRVGGREFVRVMRGLGREAFLKKALARKCARGLGLDDGVGVAAGGGG
ncbi:hypothetical protein KC343_g8693 [Hortaea werneckii]|uniref:UEV domain-containing protein n=1 Tax=Hortaea werneckii TaxID=91943 RepID=A0A3M7ESI2_HORWE|nr:hypothetical protein KC343_g8693 [Hortaea werneckii]KAI7660671.1 hypothetical protein KC319_g8611 [Hortaea werneckii]KAI7699440.1 hypothetical protein KC322_g8756 [Hortaea werneckii]RMY79400.1 hypothetical protein D0864_09097 [Hortaea werneckii]